MKVNLLRNCCLLTLALATSCASQAKNSATTPMATAGALYFDVPVEAIGNAGIEIHVPGDPDFLAVLDETSAWIMNPSTQAMERVTVDGVAQSVAVPYPIASPILGFGSLWTANGDRDGNTLYRIHPKTGEIEAIIDVPIIGYESTLAVAGGKLWILSNRDGTLSAVDPATNSLSMEVQVKPNSYGLTAGFGSVWVSNSGGWRSTTPGSVQRVDAKTGVVITTVDVGPRPLFLAAGEGGVWVINQGDGTVSRIDPETNRVVATIEVGAVGGGGDIDAGGGRVWVRASRVFLSVIHPDTNTVVKRFGPLAGSGGVRVGHGAAWVTAHDTKQVWRLPLNAASMDN